MREANEELKRLDRKKTESLSTVSHELRVPLTPIKACIENLLGEMYGPMTSKQRDRLEIALASVNDEARLIGNLLDLMRIQESRVSLDLETSDIADIVHSVVRVFEYDSN